MTYLSNISKRPREAVRPTRADIIDASNNLILLYLGNYSLTDSQIPLRGFLERDRLEDPDIFNLNYNNIPATINQKEDLARMRANQERIVAGSLLALFFETDQFDTPTAREGLAQVGLDPQTDLNLAHTLRRDDESGQVVLAGLNAQDSRGLLTTITTATLRGVEGGGYHISHINEAVVGRVVDAFLETAMNIHQQSRALEVVVEPGVPAVIQSPTITINIPMPQDSSQEQLAIAGESGRRMDLQLVGESLNLWRMAGYNLDSTGSGVNILSVIAGVGTLVSPLITYSEGFVPTAEFIVGGTAATLLSYVLLDGLPGAFRFLANRGRDAATVYARRMRSSTENGDTH